MHLEKFLKRNNFLVIRKELNGSDSLYEVFINSKVEFSFIIIEYYSNRIVSLNDDIFNRLTSNEKKKVYFLTVENVGFQTEDQINWIDFSTFADFYNYKNESFSFYCICANNISNFSKDKVSSYFVPQEAKQKGKNSNVDIVEYVNKDWLYDATSNYICILGEYGTGKSTLCRFIAYQLSLLYIKNEISSFPIVIELNHFIDNIQFKEIINTLLHKFQITIEKFNSLNEQGKLILIFDGLDEMTSSIYDDVNTKNFARLFSLINRKNKVIFTSRIEYFHSLVEEYRLLRQHDQIILFDEQVAGNIFYLNLFSPTKIKDYLSKRFSDKWIDYWNKIKRIFDLEELSKRPVLLNMICDTLPLLETYSVITSFKLYEVYSDQWLKRDLIKGKTQIPSSIKNKIMMRLALLMYQNEFLYVSPDKILELDNLYLLEIFGFSDLPYLKKQGLLYELLVCSFLKRDQIRDLFRFIHKSFMEFFVAKQFIEDILYRNLQAIETKRIRWEVVLFISENKGKLEESRSFIKSCIENSALSSKLRGNLLIIYLKCGFHNTHEYLNAENVDLFRANLGGFDISNINLSNSYLRACNFKNTKVTNSNFFASDLQYIDFSKSLDFKNIKLIENAMISLNGLTNDQLNVAKKANAILINDEFSPSDVLWEKIENGAIQTQEEMIEEIDKVRPKGNIISIKLNKISSFDIIDNSLKFSIMKNINHSDLKNLLNNFEIQKAALSEQERNKTLAINAGRLAEETQAQQKIEILSEDIKLTESKIITCLDSIKSDSFITKAISQLSMEKPEEITQSSEFLKVIDWFKDRVFPLASKYGTSYAKKIIPYILLSLGISEYTPMILNLLDTESA